MHKTERIIGIELLRIIAMLLIIVGHIIGHGGIDASIENGGVLCN